MNVDYCASIFAIAACIGVRKNGGVCVQPPLSIKNLSEQNYSQVRYIYLSAVTFFGE